MKISKGTIIRTVMLFIVIINFVLKKCGINLLPINETAVTSAVETVISVLSFVAAWWYNNSFSEKARRADMVLKQLKEGEILNV